MKVTVIDIVLFVLFFQLLSLVPFLLLHKNRKRASNIFLAAFLLAKALCISNFISLRLWDAFFQNFPHSFLFGSSFTILWGPLLYFYTKSLTCQKFRLKKTDFLHLIPFLMHFLYLSFKFHFHGAATKRELLAAGDIISASIGTHYQVFLHGSILLYTIAALRVVWQYRIQIRNSYSKIDTINLSWMYFVLFGFMLKWFGDVWFAIDTYFQHDQAILALYVSRIALFLFVNIMIYKGLRQPEIFQGIESQMPPAKPSLSESIREKYRKKLLSFMELEKPYLDPEISLNRLAEQVLIPPRSLSEVINDSLGQNFYDFINHYRIKESERILSDPGTNRKTILEILYEVGFNSKSSFHTAFKKNLGTTPTQFKKKHAA